MLNSIMYIEQSGIREKKKKKPKWHNKDTRNSSKKKKTRQEIHFIFIGNILGPNNMLLYVFVKITLILDSFSWRFLHVPIV